MYLVYTPKELHSAWETKEEAENQIRVLREYGYGNPYNLPYYKFTAGIICENGQYFV